MYLQKLIGKKTKKKMFLLRLQDPDTLVRGKYGSADPDPYQSVTDPQHWLKQIIRGSNKSLTKSIACKFSRCQNQMLKLTV